jgi:ATP-dependent DNA ligase
LDALHNDAVANGFEGIVIYNQSGVYQYNTRSSNAFKYKLPKEAEYRILSYETDKNGHPVFTCEYIDINGNTDTFKVKPKGTDTERKTIITSFNSGYKNSWYTVEFETLSKIGKPLKPCGVCLRDCNSEGSPLV